MINIKSASGRQATEQVVSKSGRNVIGGIDLKNKKTLLIIGGVFILGVIGYMIWKKSQSGSGDDSILDISSVPDTNIGEGIQSSDVPI